MWVVDRLEGEYAVIEADGITFNLPRLTLPENVHEGDCISVNVDIAETQKRKEMVNSLMDKLFGDNR